MLNPMMEVTLCTPGIFWTISSTFRAAADVRCNDAPLGNVRVIIT